MNFDIPIERRGTHSQKWDEMEQNYGVSPENGIAMWVADMDFPPPPAVERALRKMMETGVYGYYGDKSAYYDAICWWMETRFSWKIKHEWIFSTHGLVNGTGICVDAFSQPGDGVILFTPVYHAFARVIKAAGRVVVECPLVLENGRYTYDFEAYDKLVDENTKMVILCSPQNPGGQVWSRDELQGVADFTKRHDLTLVSDEIHHDLVYPGAQHIPMAKIDRSITDRLIMMTAATKAFNIAGLHIGNVIIEDEKLRAKFARRSGALGISANSFGLFGVEAAYSADGVEWLREAIAYLDKNRAVFDAAIAEIPGLKSMNLDATYLAWVDFSALGISSDNFFERVQSGAEIAANHGSSFGRGGELCARFNFALPRARLVEACERLQSVFSDLQ